MIITLFVFKTWFGLTIPWGVWVIGMFDAYGTSRLCVRGK